MGVEQSTERPTPLAEFARQRMPVGTNEAQATAAASAVVTRMHEALADIEAAKGGFLRGAVRARLFERRRQNEGSAGLEMQSVPQATVVGAAEDVAATVSVSVGNGDCGSAEDLEGGTAQLVMRRDVDDLEDVCSCLLEVAAVGDARFRLVPGCFSEVAFWTVVLDEAEAVIRRATPC